MVSISSYSVEIQSALRGFDTARFLKNTLAVPLIGYANIELWPRIRNGNPSVVERVNSINSVAKGRMSGGFLESNREGIGTYPRLALSRIAGPLNISDEMTISTTHAKFNFLLSRNISQTMGEKGKR